MRLIDFIYHIFYKMYVKDDVTKLGAFTVSSLWFSMLQFLWIMIFISLFKIIFDLKFFVFETMTQFFFLIFLVFLLNQIYLNTGNRKEKIINGFNYDPNKYIYYSVILFVVIFISMSISTFLMNKAFFSDN